MDLFDKAFSSNAVQTNPFTDVGTAEQVILEQIAQALGLDGQESTNILGVILIKNKG